MKKKKKKKELTPESNLGTLILRDSGRYAYNSEGVAAATLKGPGENTAVCVRGVIPVGAGGAVANTLFSGFSHTTDRKISSEVVLMGSFMSVIYGNVR